MRVKVIETPLGGINRRVGYQNQPPYTLYDATNFWPTDFLTGRAVLSTRPPLNTFTSPGGTVNMLCRVNGQVSGSLLQSMVCASDSDIYWWDGDSWVAATGAQASSAPTGIPVYAASFLQETYIPQVSGKPIVFNLTTGAAATIVETAGTAPTDCRMFIVWQGALWAAGQLANPHILFGSRTGNAKDWNASVPLSDEGGAFSTSGENEGVLRGPITAMFAHTADTMIVSTLEGLVAFRGHPRRGGVAEDIATSTYILGQGAWTRGPGGVAYFLTRQGLMSLGTEDGAMPTPVSRDKIPQELAAFEYNYNAPGIALEYDSGLNGIHITMRTGGVPQAWWFDMSSGGFYRSEFASYPFVLMEFPPLAQALRSAVLFAGAGYGGIGLMDTQDLSTESFSASATIGPVRLGTNPRLTARVEQARFAFSFTGTPDGGTVKFSADADGEGTIHRLDGAQEQYSVDIADLMANNSICYPKVTGAALAIKISHGAGVKVVLDQTTLDLTESGPIKTKPTRPSLGP